MDRADGYIGVLIDDLVTKGVSEPYRMFTSRAEYRLKLRADNADERLTPLGIALGCVTEDRARRFHAKSEAVSDARARLHGLRASPTELASRGISVRKDGCLRSAAAVLAIPSLGRDDVINMWPELSEIDKTIWKVVENDARYFGLLDRQEAEIVDLRRQESMEISPELDYGSISGLSSEAIEKLNRIRPETFGQASRIDGVTPAALYRLLAATRRQAILAQGIDMEGDVSRETSPS